MSAGLGLPITNDIVKAHGGTMDVHSQPAQTVFTIKLSDQSMVDFFRHIPLEPRLPYEAFSIIEALAKLMAKYWFNRILGYTQILILPLKSVKSFNP